MPTIPSLTRETAEFAAGLRFDDLPADVRRIARRCVLDGLGVTLAGTEQPVMDPLRGFLARVGGTQEARVVGDAGLRLPTPLAALWNGTAGHAMDWDDTQLAEAPGRVFGLLTHPTVPPLSAGLAIAEMLGEVDGRTFLTAFVAGFEVECKLAEAIHPDHYLEGFHSSGTMGTFGAAVCAAKLLGFDAARIAGTVGVAASMASGIRANFGTMMKPLHVGRAAENGVMAALLVADGLIASPEALDGPWGFLEVAGRGADVDLLVGRLGDPFSIVSPGVSIKPYPCGVLTHPTIDAMLAATREHGLRPEDIRRVLVHAGRNILEPIRYEIAHDGLQAKFSLAFLLSAAIVAGRAGKAEFTDDFVRSPAVQEMQRRIATVHDLEFDRLGFDRIRSRLEIEVMDGRTIEFSADERYRGGPENPLTDAELEHKFVDCAADLIERPAVDAAIAFVGALESQESVTRILGLLTYPERRLSLLPVDGASAEAP